jgi:hypothetical protein
MRIHRTTFAAAVLLAALTLTACATEGSPMTPSETDGSAPSSRPPFLTSSPSPIGPSGAPAEVPAAKWAAILADLSARDIVGEPTLISSERVEYSDGSLGCPAPGQAYTQSIVEGYRVVVRADDRVLDYRFGSGDEPRLCER